MIRVGGLKKSLNFYVQNLGVRILRRQEYQEGRFTNTFIGYTDEVHRTNLEIIYNWDQVEDYTKGNAWGNLVINVPDVYSASRHLKKHGVEFTKKPSPMKGGAQILAFIKDPDGYLIELNEFTWRTYF